MKLFHKLFLSTLDKKQLMIAVLSTFLGLVLLMLGVNYLFQIKKFSSQNELLTENTFVIQRKVSDGAILNMNKTEFTLKDQNRIRNQTFITHFQPVVVNNFDLDFQLADEGLPYMRTDIFIQSINREFLDVKDIYWDWKPSDEFVPIIIPKEFLVMLNAFMSSKGMPQISDELAKQIHFKFNLKAPNKRETFECRVVGFTNSFSAVLVPTRFMEYGSEHFGQEKEKVTQVIVSHTRNGFGAFKNFLKENHLETKSTDLIMSQIQSISFLLFNLLIVLALVIITLSTTLFTQYSQLMIMSKKFEIQTMIRLGYAPKEITQHIFRYFTRLVFWVNISVLIAFFIFLSIGNLYFAKYGFEFTDFLNFYPFVTIAFINFALLFSIKRKINHIIRWIN